MIKFLFSLLVSFFFLNAFSQSAAEEILYLKTPEIQKLKIKSCTGSSREFDKGGKTVYYFGTYLRFDKNGNIVSEDCRANPNKTGNIFWHMMAYTYVYDDSLPHQLKEATTWNVYFSPEVSAWDTSKILSLNRDSIIKSGEITQHVFYHNGEEEKTLYYDSGKMYATTISKFDERDSLKETREYYDSFLTRVTLYRENGKMLVDSVFLYDGYKYKGNLEVKNYDEQGNCIKQMTFESGALISGTITLIDYGLYDVPREITVEDLDENVISTTTNTFNKNGKLIASVTTDARNRVIAKNTYAVISGDSITKTYKMTYAASRYGASYTFFETAKQANLKTKNYTYTTKEYTVDTLLHGISDTITIKIVAKMDAKGNLVSSFTTRNKAVMSNVNLKYDGAGRITERKITGDFLVNNSVQSYSYYENGQISREERTINNESFISYYNPDGKLNKYTHGKKENPEYETTLYSFDNNGLIVKKEIFKEGKSIFVENYIYEFYHD
jgi:hypothetical protein